MTIDECHGWHRIGQNPLQGLEEAVSPETFCGHGMFELEAVRVEFGNAGRGNDYAMWIGEFEDVKSEEKGLEEGGR